MMMVILLLTVFEGIEFSGVSSGLGGASYSIESPVYSLNPALNGIDKDFLLNGEYTRVYGIVDAGRIYAGYRGISAQVFYRRVEDLQGETEVSIGYGIPLGRDTRAGINLKGFYLYQKNFGKSMGFGVDIGIFTRVWRMWKLGAVYTNINTPALGETGAYIIPAKLGFSISYNPSSSVISTFGIEKETGAPVRYMMGQSFTINEYIVLRAGFHTSPFEPSFCVGINTPVINVNFTYLHHSELGSTIIAGADYK